MMVETTAGFPSLFLALHLKEKVNKNAENLKNFPKCSSWFTCSLEVVC